MNKFSKLLIAIILNPIIVLSQVEVRKINSIEIGNYLPISNISFFATSPVLNFQFTPPSIPTYGIPETLNIDSTYDDLDDSTYEYSPKLDYGVPLRSRISLLSGVWQTIGTMKIWSLKVQILNSVNTGVVFSNFILSPTAKFYIINGDKTIIKGPYLMETFNNITQFGTFPMETNSFFLVLYESNSSNMGQNNLSITQVVAGYQSLNNEEPPILAEPSEYLNRDELRCINSIRCQPSWMTMARSVARWANGAGSTCTGTLLNNENQNGIPFFYSACHCLPNDRTVLRNASFQFRYWQTGCNTGAIEPFVEFYGATLLHEVSQSSGDQALLRLNTGPGVGDAPTYAGWSRQNSNPSTTNSGIIHHPKGGDMRFTRPKNVRDYLWNNNFWKATYNDGITRPGSSGSSLLNENQQVIGSLSRGLSSCSFRFIGDRYGKFHTIWSGASTFLSSIQNSQNIQALKLSPLSITGNPILGCFSTTEAYSVPNLLGCTYTWTVSSNLQIISGLGTSNIIVSYTFTGNTTAETWVNVVINDSKGSFPSGRRAERRLNISLNQLLGTTDGVYHYDYILSPQTVSLWGTNNASVTYNITDPTITPISWTTLTPNSTDAAAYIQGNMVTMSFNGQAGGYVACDFTYLGLCGVMTKRLEAFCLQGQSKNGLQVMASPNPVKDNIFVTVDLTTKELKIPNQNLHFNLIDANTKRLLKKWDMKNNQSQYNLNIVEFKSGVYILQITLGGVTETLKIMKL
jgi:Secretion system C-terminal sorting domain/PKD-like domain